MSLHHTKRVSPSSPNHPNHCGGRILRAAGCAAALLLALTGCFGDGTTEGNPALSPLVPSRRPTPHTTPFPPQFRRPTPRPARALPRSPKPRAMKLLSPKLRTPRHLLPPRTPNLLLLALLPWKYRVPIPRPRKLQLLRLRAHPRKWRLSEPLPANAADTLGVRAT